MAKVTMKQYEKQLYEFADMLKKKEAVMEELRVKYEMGIEMAKLIVARYDGTNGDDFRDNKKPTPPKPIKPSGTDNQVSKLKELIHEI